jgi:pyridoxamine 5'-phosphate oxidase-like protein
MFETEAELAELQELLDSSLARAGKRLLTVWDAGKRLDARQLAGFSGVRLVAVASMNSKGEPRVAPRPAAFLHGKFYLAANTKSTTAHRLLITPNVAITYFEIHFLMMGHGTASFLRKGDAAFAKVEAEWKAAFGGGRGALRGVDLFIRIDATHLEAFAQHPERYPAAWTQRREKAQRGPFGEGGRSRGSGRSKPAS